MQEALAQITPEVDRTVAMDAVVLEFDRVQDVADLIRRERGVVQVNAELIERLLEVDVVLPKGIVGVENEVLAFHIDQFSKRENFRQQRHFFCACMNTTLP